MFVFKRSEHTTQKVCQFSTLWLNQYYYGIYYQYYYALSIIMAYIISIIMACSVEQKLSHTRTPS